MDLATIHAMQTEPIVALKRVGFGVETVMVDGRVLRRAGKFTACDEGEIVREAREAALALREKAKWPG